ncbi:DUF3846 domain-containing protein [Streptomyces sp. NPDC007259]|uniref:DUF3846 domain-containing protein n=1 Tax=Streptomyces sp. NPDC007259 TaxID=3154319 RepID=UPI003452455F
MNDSQTRYALLVRPDGFFRLLDWPGAHSLETLYGALDCNYVDVVAVTPTLSMWVDDEGVVVGSAMNLYATHLYALNGTPRQPYFGNAVFTGGPDAEGDTQGLTEDQLLTLVQAVLNGLPEVIYITAQG